MLGAEPMDILLCKVHSISQRDSVNQKGPKPVKPTTIQTVVRWRYKEYIESFGLDWSVFVELHRRWNDVKVEKKAAKNVMRLLHSWMNGYTTRSIDLRDITSIEPSPEGFAD